MKEFKPSLEERKRILKNICKTKIEWKIRTILALIMYIIAAAMACGTAVFLVIYAKADINGYVFVITGLMFVFIPIVVAVGLRKTGQYRCALPYSGYANATLNLYEDDVLEYVFWGVGMGNSGAFSKKNSPFPDDGDSAFTIARDKITTLKIKDDICTIIGKGTLDTPGWDYKKDEVMRDIKPCKKFSFIMAFDDKNAEKILSEWYMGAFRVL